MLKLFLLAFQFASWHAGCPVPPSDLRVLTIRYVDYNGKEQSGPLTVHKAVAYEVSGIFEELHRQRFPIQEIRSVDDYGGNDGRSMEANNTSAFNCRASAARISSIALFRWAMM